MDGASRRVCRPLRPHQRSETMPPGSQVPAPFHSTSPLTPIMKTPVTLFTGQWADRPLGQLAPLVREMDYDDVELACWGDHFDPAQALASPDYGKDKWVGRSPQSHCQITQGMNI